MNISDLLKFFGALRILYENFPSFFFCHFWVPYIIFKFCPWNGRLRKTCLIIKKNKKGNFFPVHLDLKRKAVAAVTGSFIASLLASIPMADHPSPCVCICVLPHDQIKWKKEMIKEWRTEIWHTLKTFFVLIRKSDPEDGYIKTNRRVTVICSYFLALFCFRWDILKVKVKVW